MGAALNVVATHQNKNKSFSIILIFSHGTQVWPKMHEHALPYKHLYRAVWHGVATSGAQQAGVDFVSLYGVQRIVLTESQRINSAQLHGVQRLESQCMNSAQLHGVQRIVLS